MEENNTSDTPTTAPEVGKLASSPAASTPPSVESKKEQRLQHQNQCQTGTS